MKTNILETSIGRISVYAGDLGITEVRFSKHHEETPSRLVLEALRQLESYFSGDLQNFDLPLSLEGTDFQVRVWDSLRGLAFGETTSYGSIAHAVGSPRASRAVGNAVGLNPIPIIIPCHRVIHASGGLGGFSGGLSKKRWLLGHEAPRNWAMPAGAASSLNVGI